MINNLNIELKTTKLLEENVEVNLHDHGFGNGFLDMTPTQTTKFLKYKLCSLQHYSQLPKGGNNPSVHQHMNG